MQLSSLTFKDAFDIAAVGIAYVGLDGRFLLVNPALTRMTGYSNEELLSLTFSDITHHEDIEKDWEQARRLLEGEIDSYTMEKRYIKKDGSVLWINLTGSIKRCPEGEAEYFIACIDDISARKKTEEALHEALRASDEFLSIASHELKTPLTSLRLQTQLIRHNLAKGNKDFMTEGKLLKYADQTDAQVTRLSRLVDDMLDVSRIQSGKLTITKEHVDIVKTINDVAERLLIQPSFEGESSLIGYWDRVRIEQEVTNLLTNGIRYGLGKPLHIKVMQKNNEALLSFQDHGIGIAEENRKKIFNRFERAISHQEISGMGLGLFIAREIVESHHGEIWVESEGQGKGSTFYVQLPLNFPEA